MVNVKRNAKFEIDPLTITAQHELWDGNIQDHADQGVSIVISAAVEGRDTALLRFNCFDFEKSYVYGPDNDNLEPIVPAMLRQDGKGYAERSTFSGRLYRMDTTADGNAISWTIRTLKTMLPAMLKRAGYPEIASRIDQENLNSILPDLEMVARDIYISERNTVKHNRGTDIFEAGNIRFGLEMRRIPVGDGGLAIHVLTDVGGTKGKSYAEETEILAFDCFKDGPHYHYGPRNKNHRIYWDTTLVQDPLGWVLDKLKNGMLRSMVERAGYPGVAIDIDQSVVDGVLPELELRAREMEAGGLPEKPTPNLVSD
tara:strand:- start:441 stop:1379 length:939 start_codon:yes stop_codon:yes gene_type:complete